MTFWQRSNTVEFTKHLDVLLDLWNDEGFNQPTESDDDKWKRSAEYVLDFYDEACAAVMMKACDEEAMKFYLGPMIMRHVQKLKGFISTWREKNRCDDEWACVTKVVEKWDECRREGR